MYPDLQALADRMEILDLVADLAWGPDLLDEPRYRQCFGAVLEVVNSAFTDADGARTVTGDEWVNSVLSTQSRFPVRRHTLTSPSVTVDGDAAEVLVLQHARFAAGADDPRFLEVAGPLRLSLRRESGRWKVVRLNFEVLDRAGDPQLYRRMRREPA